MVEHPVLQKLVGWTEKKFVKHGIISPVHPELESR
jgi:hypothetical protein